MNGAATLLRTLLLLCTALANLVWAAPFTLHKLADGVYATVRQEPPGFGVESNSLIVIGPDDVLVVDAQSNLPATAEVLAAIRTLTDKPVRYVVNTHWHDDHIIGNQLYRDTFPKVDFIGHPASLAYLQGPGIKARHDFHKNDVPEFSAMLRDALKQGRNLAGKPLSEEERLSYESDLQIAGGYATVPPDFMPPLPTLTTDSKLTLHSGKRRVEVLHLGRGHTAGDLVVWLPDDGIVATGDLLVWPIPLIGGNQSHVSEWSGTLSKLQALGAKVYLPGHGPVLHDDRYLKQVAALMSSVTEQTRAALQQEKELAAVRKRVKLDAERKAFAGDSPVRNMLFSNYVQGPAVESAFAGLHSK